LKAKINGINIAYDDAGSGPAVLLVHGYPLCRRMWRPQAEALREAGYRVIAPDLRGFGDSESGDAPFSMDRFADDMAGLLDHLGIEQAAVAGMSMGGYVLLNLLERHPRRIAAALFVVTRAGADDPAGKNKRTALADEVRRGRPQAVGEAFRGVLFAEQTPARMPGIVAEVEGMMASADPQGLAGGLLAMRERKDYAPSLPSFRLPCLVIGAEQDRAIPPDQSEALAAGLPDSTLRLLPGGGHMVNLEQPEAFNAALVEFLDGLGLQ